MVIQEDEVARLLEDDKAFGRAVARLIAYVRINAVPMMQEENQ